MKTKLVAASEDPGIVSTIIIYRPLTASPRLHTLPPIKTPHVTEIVTSGGARYTCMPSTEVNMSRMVEQHSMARPWKITPSPSTEGFFGDIPIER